MSKQSKSVSDLLLGYQAKRSGGIINTAEIAMAFAGLVLKNTTSSAMYGQQIPLSAIDQGETWLVRGTKKPDSNQLGLGPWEIVINKIDARVLHLQNPPDFTQ